MFDDHFFAIFILLSKVVGKAASCLCSDVLKDSLGLKMSQDSFSKSLSYSSSYAVKIWFLSFLVAKSWFQHMT